jgi:formylglycine-generating enzyme required for sulfatase activity
MCYPPIDQIKSGMKMPANYLARIGYRLPTEAEWEYVARAGSTTSRPYGEDQRFLEHYGWYLKTANNRSWPLGRLKPNDLGLFDALGNTWDWTLNSYRAYPNGAEDKPAEDLEETTAFSDDISRMLRGGSFFNLASNLRSALRSDSRPTIRIFNVGFRLSRTYR